MSPPDMRLPIQYALYYPERAHGVAERLDWRKPLRLEFEPPDRERFPAIALGEEAAKAGGTSGAVLNAANEAAVEAFLDGELHFTEIVPACRSVLGTHHFEPSPSLERAARTRSLGAAGDFPVGMCLIAAARRLLARRPVGVLVILRVAARPGRRHLRARAGPLSRRQGVRREVREVLSSASTSAATRSAAKWGETEYGIGILPLGGYVKMLGQDDNPANIAEQVRESQVAGNTVDAKEITGPDGKTYLIDKRSYLAKSVPQRMAIISAGVIMNIIFAFIFATVAYKIGVPYNPSIASGTSPGSSAWAGRHPAGRRNREGRRHRPSRRTTTCAAASCSATWRTASRSSSSATAKQITKTLTPKQRRRPGAGGHRAAVLAAARRARFR